MTHHNQKDIKAPNESNYCHNYEQYLIIYFTCPSATTLYNYLSIKYVYVFYIIDFYKCWIIKKCFMSILAMNKTFIGSLKWKFLMDTH